MRSNPYSNLKTDEWTEYTMSKSSKFKLYSKCLLKNGKPLQVKNYRKVNVIRN